MEEDTHKGLDFNEKLDGVAPEGGNLQYLYFLGGARETDKGS